MDTKEHLELWVKGEPIHDTEVDRCVPDFSCCQSHYKADEESRKRYLKAFLEHDEATGMELLMMFASQALSTDPDVPETVKVHIAGDSNASQTH